MARTPIVTLGDVVLEGRGPFSWELRYGVEPSQEHYTVTQHCAEALSARMGHANPVALRIERPDGKPPLVYDRLYVLTIEPGPKPYLRRVRVADARAWWPYKWLAPSFNVVRLGGDTFLATSQGLPEKQVVDPRLVYAPHSLNPFGGSGGSTKWGAVDALEHILISPDPDGLGEPVVLDLDPSFEGAELEDPALDMPGDAAVRTLLGYLSGVAVYQSYGGAIVITDSRGPKGEQIAQATRQGRLKTGPESLEVDRSYLMPSKVVSLFTVDAEMLFISEEESDTVTSLSTLDEPTLINVARVTEQQLDVGGELLGEGSFARLVELFSAWGAFGLINRALSLSLMRDLLLEHNGGRLLNTWGVTAAGASDTIFADRVTEAIRSWRKLWRIAPLFWDRLESISATRAAIINTEIPSRAPASVYADYIRRPSMRGILKTGVMTGIAIGTAVQAYRGGGISAATEAPASVHVEDASAGILAVNPKKSPDGWYDFTVLGFPVGGVTPTIGGLAQANKGLAEAFANWGLIDLDSDFHLGIVASVTPSTPQNRQRFYAVEVPIPGGKGPPLYSRVFPGIASARLGYQDADRDSVINAIKGLREWNTLQHLLVDRDIIENVADANAKRVADLFRTRTFGGHDIDMDPTLEPSGSLSSVRHIMARGVTATHLRFDPDTAPLDILRYLPKATRMFIQRSIIGRSTRLAP